MYSLLLPIALVFYVTLSTANTDCYLHYLDRPVMDGEKDCNSQIANLARYNCTKGTNCRWVLFQGKCVSRHKVYFEDFYITKDRSRLLPVIPECSSVQIEPAAYPPAASPKLQERTLSQKSSIYVEYNGHGFDSEDYVADIIEQSKGTDTKIFVNGCETANASADFENTMVESVEGVLKNGQRVTFIGNQTCSISMGLRMGRIANGDKYPLYSPIYQFDISKIEVKGNNGEVHWRSVVSNRKLPPCVRNVSNSDLGNYFCEHTVPGIEAPFYFQAYYPESNGVVRLGMLQVAGDERFPEPKDAYSDNKKDSIVIGEIQKDGTLCSADCCDAGQECRYYNNIPRCGSIPFFYLETPLNLDVPTNYTFPYDGPFDIVSNASCANRWKRRAYFFLGSQYATYNYEVDPPQDVPVRELSKETWNGLPAKKIDAALRWDGDTAYFFSGPYYYHYSIEHDIFKFRRRIGAIESGQPIWRGLVAFASGIDAALRGEDGNAYFFQGDKVIEYKIAEDEAVSPRPIKEVFPGIPSLFERGIDAALNYEDGRKYLFKGNKYVRIDKNGNFDSEIRSLGLWKLDFPKVDAAFNWGRDKGWAPGTPDPLIPLDFY